MADVKTFEDLEAWQACRELRHFAISRVVKKLPPDGKFGLAAQTRDAIRSTTNNIAEGCGRFHYRDNFKFCSNSRGSLYEVLDHLIDARDEFYIDQETLDEGRRLFAQAARLFNGCMNYLGRSAEKPSRVGEPREEPAYAGASTPINQ